MLTDSAIRPAAPLSQTAPLQGHTRTANSQADPVGMPTSGSYDPYGTALEGANDVRSSDQPVFTNAHQPRSRGVTFVAFLMILFGLAEVATGVRHAFFGLVISAGDAAGYMGVALGLCYFVGGWLILTRRKWAIALALILLLVDVLGRIAMVAAGLYPLDSFRQVFAVVMGTAIAVFFGLYLGWKFKCFT